MGKQYSSEKRTEAFRGNQHTAKKSGSVQSEHNQKPMKTYERIAQENHSSASSVRRAEYYAHGVDVADELSPGFRDRFFREELHIPDYLLENLGKAKPEEQAEIFNQRALDRERQQTEPKYAELCRRFLADEADFSAENMEKCGIRAENRFENRELEACVDTLVREIRAQGLALLEPKVP